MQILQTKEYLLEKYEKFEKKIFSWNFHGKYTKIPEFSEIFEKNSEIYKKFSEFPTGIFRKCPKNLEKSDNFIWYVKVKERWKTPGK